MDVMEDNAVEPCEILIFLSKSDDHISVLEDKRVDIHQSRLDVNTGTVNLVYTEAGRIERLLGIYNGAEKLLTIRQYLRVAEAFYF